MKSEENNPRRKKTPYQRIVDAAKNGTGTRLSADDCQILASDTAIDTRAYLDDDGTDAEFDLCVHGKIRCIRCHVLTSDNSPENTSDNGEKFP